jgi:hypothetical protein
LDWPPYLEFRRARIALDEQAHAQRPRPHPIWMSSGARYAPFLAWPTDPLSGQALDATEQP